MGKAERKLSLDFSDTAIKRLAPPTDRKRAIWYDKRKSSLCVAVSRAASKTFYVVRRRGRQVVWLKLGNFPDINVDEAHRRTDEALTKFADPANDPQAIKRRVVEEQDAARSPDRLKASLGALCDAYIEHLGGKQSAKNVASLFRCHVQSKPIAKVPAAKVTRGDITDLVRTVIEAGHKRTAAKLRSFLRRAYVVALGADGDANISVGFKIFRIEHNPVGDVATVKDASIPGERALSVAELHAYYARLLALPPGNVKDALLLLLLLGGQRPAQLLRCRIEDVVDDTICILDSKGKRETPRRHLLPLTGDALEIVSRRSKNRTKGMLFCTGSRQVHDSTISHAVQLLAASMLAAGEIKSTFRQGDIRRTVETLMASLDISKDIRGQLQSHGLSGVQTRHYDRYEYLPQKRAALAVWVQFLDGPRREQALERLAGILQAVMDQRIKNSPKPILTRIR